MGPEKRIKLAICLVLFFSEQEDIRKRALSAGVDEVVVKSPDAGEIVQMVSKYLT